MLARKTCSDVRLDVTVLTESNEFSLQPLSNQTLYELS